MVCCHLSKALRSDGDKGLTDSKDRPGVGQVRGQASAKNTQIYVSLDCSVENSVLLRNVIISITLPQCMCVCALFVHGRGGKDLSEFVQSFRDLNGCERKRLETAMWRLEIAARRLARLFAFQSLI